MHSGCMTRLGAFCFRVGVFVIKSNAVLHLQVDYTDSDSSWVENYVEKKPERQDADEYISKQRNELMHSLQDVMRVQASAAATSDAAVCKLRDYGCLPIVELVG